MQGDNAISFIDTIVRAGEEKRNAVLREAGEYAKNFLSAAQVEGESRAASYLTQRKQEIAAKIWRKNSAGRIEMRKKLLARRTEIVNGLFEQIRVKLSAFTQKPEYAEFLKKSIRAAFLVLGENDFTILCKCVDQSAVQKIVSDGAGFESLSISPDDSIRIGGLCFLSKNQKLRADDSLDKRLLKARNEFEKECGCEFEGTCIVTLA
jgi:vacuolar-type H+-ATPase subunit E/Vma4